MCVCVAVCGCPVQFVGYDRHSQPVEHPSAPTALRRLTEHLLRNSLTATSSLVYRDKQWVQLPTAVLVTGDLVALRCGERAPARVSSIIDPRLSSQDATTASGSNPSSPTGSGAALGEGAGVTAAGGGTDANTGAGAPRAMRGRAEAAGFGLQPGEVPRVFEPGQRVWTPLSTTSRADAGGPDSTDAGMDGAATTSASLPAQAQAAEPEGGHVAAAARAASDSRDKTLQLCGDMGLFVLLETPAERLLYQATHRPASRVEPQVLTQARVLSVVIHRATLVLALLVAAVHLLYYAASSDDLPPSRVWLTRAAVDVTALVAAALPLTLPLLLCVAEAFGTAVLLATREVELVRARWKRWSSKLQRDRVLAQQQQRRTVAADARSRTQQLAAVSERRRRRKARRGTPRQTTRGHGHGQGQRQGQKQGGIGARQGRARPPPLAAGESEREDNSGFMPTRQARCGPPCRASASVVCECGRA